MNSCNEKMRNAKLGFIETILQGTTLEVFQYNLLKEFESQQLHRYLKRVYRASDMGKDMENETQNGMSSRYPIYI